MLSTVVLPAPLGPMTDTISPRGTSKLTRVTACTPPNALLTSRMETSASEPAAALPDLPSIAARAESLFKRPSELAQPPFAPAVVLHVAVGLALPDPGQPQVELLDVLVLADRLRVAVEHDAAALHHVAVLRELQRDGGVLLGQQDGHAFLAVQPAHGLENLVNEHGRETHRRLVEQHELRPRHQRPSDGQHLLLASRDVPRLEPTPFLKSGEVGIHQVEVPARGLTFAPGVGAGQEVLLDGQVLEDPPPLHDLHDPPAHDLAGILPVDRLAHELDGALGDVTALRAQQARNRLQRRGLAGAVGPEEGHDAPRGNP